jgi:hypothetical protein
MYQQALSLSYCVDRMRWPQYHGGKYNPNAEKEEKYITKDNRMEEEEEEKKKKKEKKDLQCAVGFVITQQIALTIQPPLDPVEKETNQMR